MFGRPELLLRIRAPDDEPTIFAPSSPLGIFVRITNWNSAFWLIT